MSFATLHIAVLDGSTRFGHAAAVAMATKCLHEATDTGQSCNWDCWMRLKAMYRLSHIIIESWRIQRIRVGEMGNSGSRTSQPCEQASSWMTCRITRKRYPIRTCTWRGASKLGCMHSSPLCRSQVVLLKHAHKLLHSPLAKAPSLPLLSKYKKSNKVGSSPKPRTPLNRVWSEGVVRLRVYIVMSPPSALEKPADRLG